MAKKSSKISKVTPFTIFCWIGFAVFLFFLAFYAYYMLSTSFKDPFGGINYYADNILGLPKIFQFDQYVNAWNRFRVQLVDSSWVYIEEMLIYSFAYAIVVSLAMTSSCLIVGYATGRFNVFFNKIIYGFVIVAMTLPLVGSTPSQVALMSKMGLYDSWIGIIFSKFFFISVYYIIFHETFRGIPKTYSEAAKIDGANNFYIMIKIMFPLVKVTFTTIFVLLFIANWNDYSTPVIFLKSYPNIALGLYYFRLRPDNVLGTGFDPAQMAACVMTMIPVIIFFVAFRKQLVGNVSMGGLKE